MRKSRIKDLTGQRFGKLLVVKFLEKNNKNQAIWECLCDCGRTTKCRTATLNFGAQKSCGCSKITSQLINLIGQKFGSFTVLERVYIKNNKNKLRGIWKCRCDCGEIKLSSISSLKYLKLQCCQKCRNYNGENNGNWNSKITNEERFFDRKNDPKFRKWKKLVYKKDNNTCQITGKTGNICAHHLESWSSNKDLRYELANGITLLQSVHRKFHSLYGLKYNTREQFNEFKNNLTKEQIESFK